MKKKTFTIISIILVAIITCGFIVGLSLKKNYDSREAKFNYLTESMDKGSLFKHKVTKERERKAFDAVMSKESLLWSEHSFVPETDVQYVLLESDENVFLAMFANDNMSAADGYTKVCYLDEYGRVVYGVGELNCKYLDYYCPNEEKFIFEGSRQSGIQSIVYEFTEGEFNTVLDIWDRELWDSETDEISSEFISAQFYGTDIAENIAKEYLKQLKEKSVKVEFER